MTPKNREELVGMLTRGFATSGVAFWTDATTGELLDALHATGLAIVPLEPTSEMENAGSIILNQAEAAHTYCAMLEASPFRAKLEGPTPALALPTCVS
jgi:hypothetical protein